MSTYARDLYSEEIGGQSLAPASISVTTNGSAVDMLQGDGLCNALVGAGVFSGGTNPTVTVTVEESDASGSGFAAVSPSVTTAALSAAGAYWVPAFQRSKRYVRLVFTIAGGPSGIIVGGSVWEQRKVFTGADVTGA